MSQPFHHVVLHGVGLLGASLGLALKKHGLARIVTGVGRANSSSLDIALRRGAIDHASTNLAAAIRGTHLPPPHASTPADLVVLCTPIRQFPQAMRTLAPALAPGTLVTDVGSTKAEVMRWAAEFLPPPPAVQFIGSHPMAGSEKSGPEAARDSLYDKAVCLLCPPETHSENAQRATVAALARIRAMWQALNMRIIELPGDVHDAWVATISHLPHAAAFALVQTAGRSPEMLQAVAGGFLDSTRVASSDVSMWTDIFLTNKPAVLAAMDTYTAELASLRRAIAEEDEPAVRAYLMKARETREALLAQRRASGLPTRSNHTAPGGGGGEDPA
jgi:prephenate dehydrogenase